MKWLAVIPIYIVLALYGVAVYITTFIAFWAILLTGRYPTGLFNFARGFMAWQAHAYAYFPLLLSDEYPGDESWSDTVRYEAREPERLSRLLLIPKLLSFLLGITSTVVGLVGIGLILAAIPAWFAILVMGCYPRGLFNMVVAGAQWSARVTAWQWLLRDDWSLLVGSRGVAALVGAGTLVVGVISIFSWAAAFLDTDGEDRWREFSSAEGAFSVVLPGTPEEVTETLYSPFGAIEWHSFFVQREDAF